MGQTDFIHIDSDVVLKKQKEKSVRKSMEPYTVHPYILNHAADGLLLLTTLSILFNNSLSEGVLPCIWKKLIEHLFQKKTTLASN